MSRRRLIEWGGPAAIAGGVAYLIATVAVILIYDLFAERTTGTFVGSHAFIHILDVIAFALLAVGAAGVYLDQADRLGRPGRAGFYVTLAGFGLSVLGGLAIIAAGLAVSDQATLGLLDMITHPVAHALYAVGSLILGVELVSRGALSRAGALLVAAGPILLFAMFMLGLGGTDSAWRWLVVLPAVAIGVGWILLGSALGRERAGVR